MGRRLLGLLAPHTPLATANATTTSGDLTESY
jgi:hypothetical protein